nr:hypothetical protein CFP56_38870 [Quercus suber]
MVEMAIVRRISQTMVLSRASVGGLRGGLGPATKDTCARNVVITFRSLIRMFADAKQQSDRSHSPRTFVAVSHICRLLLVIIECSQLRMSLCLLHLGGCNSITLRILLRARITHNASILDVAIQAES